MASPSAASSADDTVGPAEWHSGEVTDWWLDELTTVGPEHLDQAYVDGYDAKSQVDPSEDIELLTTLGLGSGATIIDLGAGTGVFSVAAARTGASVIACDVSPVMAGRLRRRAEEERLDNLTVVETGFLSYRHTGEPVEFVYSRNALHQLPDFWKVVALRRISDLLVPGGTLRLRDLVFDIGPREVEETLDAWLSRAVDDPATGYTAEEFAEHIRSEFSTYTWLLNPMLERSGFEIIEHEVRGSVYAAYTCRRTDRLGSDV